LLQPATAPISKTKALEQMGQSLEMVGYGTTPLLLASDFYNVTVCTMASTLGLAVAY
jgi:hypothetical protein